MSQPPPPVTSAATPGRSVGLDALRGLAIALVIARHAAPEVLGGAGIAGVTLFFALSGFLITGLLVRDVQSEGRINYRRFYAHRFFRLVPALLALVIAFILVEGVFNLTGHRSLVPWSTFVALTYTSDLPWFWDIARSLGHLWTLAIEEQFYLLWPALIAFALRRRIQGRVIVVCLVGIYAALAATLIYVAPAYDKIYPLPTSWGAAMLIGAAGRIYWPRLTALKAMNGRALHVTAVIALMVLAGASLWPGAKDNPVAYFLLPAGIAIATLALIRWATARPALPSALRPLVLLGLISYAAYLWNYALTVWFKVLTPDWWRLIVPLATIAAATASWFLVESIGRRWRRQYDDARPQPARSAID